ncbi:MAG TPA: enoyl-CoA hydratase-related protein [candidate division Zixibacteria bacterium]|nr:enoyl-CoA hydratase-related protein [candidate division Zixibacteria bacterium]
METQKILYETRDRIAWITLNRPESLNAVNREMQRELIRCCQLANQDPEVQVVIVRGAGERAFSVGGDLKDRARANEAAAEARRSPLEERQARHAPGIHTPPQAFAALDKPSIALLHGYVIGTGLLIALACDIRIAADNARLGLSEVRRGFMPASGGTQRLARIVGIPKALEICLSGELYDAQEAYRIGLVNQVVGFDELAAAGEKMARSFAKGAPLALRYIKEAIYKGSDLPLEQALRLESDLATFVLTTEDSKEGPRAFVEKREPEWKGR